MIGRFLIGTLPREQFVQRDEWSASAALHRHRTAMGFSQKIFERDEEIGAQAPLLPSNSIQVSPLQQRGKKTLGKVLSFFRTVTLPPHEPEQCPPIAAAEFLQRLFRRRRKTFLRRQNYAPMRGDKRDPTIAAV